MTVKLKTKNADDFAIEQNISMQTVASALKTKNKKTK
jgi:hypothetical protein